MQMKTESHNYGVCSISVLILLAVIFTKTRQQEPLLIEEEADDVREYMGYYNEEGAGRIETKRR